MYQNQITCKSGSIRLDAEHQGRIFAELDGMLVHRWDDAVARHFDPVAFNNLGGNSLWPAPEGGDFAFNYLGGDWLVQPGINTAPSELIGSMICQRTVTLSNRKGQSLPTTLRREVAAIDDSAIADTYGVSAIGYHETDSIHFAIPQEPSRAVVAAWSLEQFPGADGIIAFGCTADAPERAINRGYYGNPDPRLAFGENWFKFTLGGEDRLQIGLSASHNPQFIGAYDPQKQLLIIRRCAAGTGTRIDMADNDQPNGIYGADDQYSIFNGATLDFFELETLAPVIFNRDGLVAGSILSSESRFYHGAPERLLALLHGVYGMTASFAF